MPDTFTTNIGLTKVETGGSNNAWGEKYNRNFDYLDVFFSPPFAGNPNGAVQGDYAGQRLFDTVNRITWTCCVPGASSVAEWTAGGELPLNTIMPHRGATAPLGWSVVDTAGFDQAALRLRGEGSVEAGGTLDFTEAFGSGLTTEAHVLTAAEMPEHHHTVANHQHGMNHTHSVAYYSPDSLPGSTSGADPNERLMSSAFESAGAETNSISAANSAAASWGDTASRGGGQGHTHSMPAIDVKYVDTFLCQRTA